MDNELLPSWPSNVIKTTKRLQDELNRATNPVTKSVLRKIISQKMGGELIDLDGVGMLLSNMYSCVRSIACARAISKHLKGIKKPYNIWAQTLNNSYAQAGIYWCKIFGTDSEPSHWKRLLTNHLGAREEILKTTDLSLAEYESYWESMTELRNKKLAHDDTSVTGYLPNFDIAIKICSALHEQIKHKLNEHGQITKELTKIEVLDFGLYVLNVHNDAETVFSVAITSTKDFQTHN
jgi:hypothetical protein